jgi:hypothetical protein
VSGDAIPPPIHNKITVSAVGLGAFGFTASAPNNSGSAPASIDKLAADTVFIMSLREKSRRISWSVGIGSSPA